MTVSCELQNKYKTNKRNQILTYPRLHPYLCRYNLIYLIKASKICQYQTYLIRKTVNILLS